MTTETFKEEGVNSLMAGLKRRGVKCLMAGLKRRGG